jgi:hypothetical protein
MESAAVLTPKRQWDKTLAMNTAKALSRAINICGCIITG